jgi:hypothetical protein
MEDDECVWCSRKGHTVLSQGRSAGTAEHPAGNSLPDPHWRGEEPWGILSLLPGLAVASGLPPVDR